MQINVHPSWNAAEAWNMLGILIAHSVLMHIKEVRCVNTEEEGEGGEAKQTLW